jgi:hypothetical protein
MERAGRRLGPSLTDFFRACNQSSRFDCCAVAADRGVVDSDPDAIGAFIRLTGIARSRLVWGGAR